MKERPKEPVRIVVCAANRYADKIFLGARHFDERMREAMHGFDVPAWRKAYGETQGFIDQWGVFMDRKEALLVATAAGQIASAGDASALPGTIGVRRPKGSPADLLFSEDLY